MRELHTEILIVGGGLGGVAAALSALRLGRCVILTEDSDWLGGQLTTQAVPPDEHEWIEQAGATETYRWLREGIRNYYRRHYPLLPEVSPDPYLNPGMGNVSPLCHEPRVAVAVIDELLARYRASGQLQVLLEHRPVSVEVDGDQFSGVTLVYEPDGEQVIICAEYIIDATELGDLLPLGNVEHVIGAESQSQTGEPHALPGEPNPLDQQAATWCFAFDYFPDEDYTIAKPEMYDFWREYQADFWPSRQLSWMASHPVTLETYRQKLFNGLTDAKKAADLWHYRRIFYRKHYPDGMYPSDIVIANWVHIDYWLNPLVGVSDEAQKRYLYEAMQLSLSMMYWMQTEAPRHDGGIGYPGLRLRGDITDTSHGLAKRIYVRESRRIQAQFTVTENHVGVEAREDRQGAEVFADTVGIGSYRIDLHPSTMPRTYVDISNWPFQIPLGALLPVRVKNLLAANKNIGSTHITNGCYRLHPVEWNIGEAAGAFAAYCLNHAQQPQQVRDEAAKLADFQTVLTQLGVPLHWPEDIRLTPRLKLFGTAD